MIKNYPYKSYKENLIETYGCPVYRVGVDAHFSCPNRDKNRKGGCVFCDELGSSAVYLRTSESNIKSKSDFIPDIDSKIPSYRIESIKLQIERGKKFIVRRYKAEKFSLYYQSFSNTYAPIEELRKIYDLGIEQGDWEELIISTRPDCINDNVVNLLTSYKNRVKRVWVELGLQSGSNEILQKMNRGHSVEDFEIAAKKLLDAGIFVSAHLLLGFPGENLSCLDKTAAVIRKIHPQAIKIHNLNIPSGTKLYNEYLEGEIAVPCTERHLEKTIFILRNIPSDIVIQRFVCDTPSHRKAAPRYFDDKSKFLRKLEKKMNERGIVQGDLCINC